MFYKKYFCCSVEKRWDRGENWRCDTCLTDQIVPFIRKQLMIVLFIKIEILGGKEPIVFEALEH